MEEIPLKNKVTLRVINYGVIYKNKLIECSACSGTGWYDSCDENGNSLYCDGCNGRGKVIER